MEKLFAASNETSAINEIRRREGCFAHTIYQEEIEELLREERLEMLKREEYTIKSSLAEKLVVR